MAPRWLMGVVLLLLAAPALAEEPPPESPSPEPSVDPKEQEADEAFQLGVMLSKKEQWAKALAAFERAAALTMWADALFNIAYCRRALGQYVKARAAIRRAIALGAELEPDQLTRAQALDQEFDNLIVRVDVSVAPHRGTRLSVGGLGIVRAEGEPDDVYMLGGAAGKGTRLARKRFTLLLDPGFHVFHAERAGHWPAVEKRTYHEGERDSVALRIDKEQPATVSIKTRPSAANVFIDGVRHGSTPFADQKYPPGKHDLRVQKTGYEDHYAQLNLRPGEPFDVELELKPYRPPLYTRWWFWGSAVAILGTAGLVTYFVVRPEPEPPPYDGGSTGWVVMPEALRF